MTYVRYIFLLEGVARIESLLILPTPVLARWTLSLRAVVADLLSGARYLCVVGPMVIGLASAAAQVPGGGVSAQRAIQGRLPSAAGGAKVAAGAASDADVAEAVGKAVVDFLDGTLPTDLTPADVVTEAVRTRAGNRVAVDAILTGVTEAILTLEPDSRARAVLDESTTAACLAVTPEDVAELVRSQISLLTTSVVAQSLLPVGKRPADALLPVEAYTERIVAGAIKAVRKVPTAKLARHIEDIVAKALSVAPSYLFDDIAAASARSSSSGTVVLAPLTGGSSNLVKTLLNGVPNTQEDVAAVVAGVMRGRGDSVAAAVRIELANNRPAFTAYTDAVLAGVHQVAIEHRDFHVTFLRDEGAKFDRAALVAGAAALWPSEVLKFAQLSMEMPGSNTTLEIARAAGRAVPLMAPEAAAYCAGTRGTKAEDVVQGFVEGAHPLVVGSIVARQLSAMGTIAGGDAKRVVAGAIAGARNSGKEHVLAPLCFEASRVSRFPIDVADQAMASVPPAMKYIAAISVVAADIGSAPELIQHVESVLAEDPAQKAAFSIGAAAVVQVQADVRNFLAATISGLSAASSDAARLAVIYGVTLVNPKGAPVVAAAGIAKCDEKLWNAVTEVASVAGPAKAASVRLASDAARSLRKSPANGFNDFVGRALFLHPSRAADIAAAAVVTLPESAPQIARAASTRAGAAAARMVPALLAFSQLQRSDASRSEHIAAAGRITAAVVTGIGEAQLRDGETAAITGAVDAAVQWACLSESAGVSGKTTVARPIALLSAPPVSLAVGGAIESVVQSAVAASKAHGIAIARVAAETLATYSRGTFTDAEGRLAAIVRSAGALNFSGQPATELDIRNAVDFGITAHNASAAGASALDVVNYSRKDGINQPVTAFRDQ